MRCDEADFTRRVWRSRADAHSAREQHGKEWVAQHLEALGHEVIVADPNYAPMYGSRSRKVKTDNRDTAALFDACRLGIYRRAHRVSAAQRTRRQQLRIRRHLVQLRSRGISLLRATLRQEGWRLPSGSAEAIDRRASPALALPPVLLATLAPLRRPGCGR